MKNQTSVHHRLWSRGFLAFVLASVGSTAGAQTPYPGLSQQIPPAEYSALLDLYNQTGGDHWFQHEGWKDPTAPRWDGLMLTGVEVDENRGVVTKVGHVTTIHLSGNHLNGNIPGSLSDLTELFDLDLSDNQLSGSIPDSLGDLANLFALRLSHNQLSGSIPENLANLGKLETINVMVIELSDNQLSGSIPASLGNMTNLGVLDLDFNQLSGSIPASLGNMAKLVTLDLEYNQLRGNIPASLGNLANLVSLDLNNNQLSGSIPTTLEKLPLSWGLYLDHNQLTGSIPDFSANRTLSTLSVNDNCFDVADGTVNGATIERMIQAGEHVYYLPQNACPSVTVKTTSATGVGNLAATLNGSADPNGLATSAYFEIGLDTGYGTRTLGTDIGSGTSEMTFSETVSGLVPNTIYHYRAVAAAGGARYFGGDYTFTTEPSVLILAMLSADAYNYPPKGYDGSPGYGFVGDYKNLVGVSPPSGFVAAVYTSSDQTQTIVSFRGTVPIPTSIADVRSFTTIHHVMADYGFLTGTPTATLQDYCHAAALLTWTVLTANPNANITLTGHSLGGALAQVVAKASGLTGVAFNAPETGNV